jgi:putative SOS response-associated peptidase YedK
VVLEQEAWDHWPDPDVTNREELEPWPPPTEEGTLVDHPVDRAVGTVRNDGPELVEAAAPSDDWGPSNL